MRGNHHTGVTVILPGPDNAFSLKYTAASYIHNGFGKSCGLVQIGELGTLETPIALTNTLNTGLVWDALVQYTIDRCQADNVPVYSINPVVGECNDCQINDILHRAVTEPTCGRLSPGRTRILPREMWEPEPAPCATA